MAAIANGTKEIWASLQKQLDMVARFLLGSLSLAYRPRLVLKDAETASTDGRRVVKMPRRFLGVGLEDGRPEIFLGLLAHEVGHYKRGHVPKMIAVSAVLMLGGFAAVAWLANQPWFISST